MPEVAIQKKVRIAWIDYYKGLVIVLVVLGHATGLFNPYIYQFHMAAFFFASGYLDTTENKSWLKLVIDKFFSLWLPLFTFLVLFSGMDTFLVHNNWYSLIYRGTFPGFWVRLRDFVVQGNCGSPFLGACWFVVVLMGIILLQKAILLLLGGQKGLGYAGIAVFLFLMGYWMIECGNTLAVGPFRLDLVFLGNFYYSAGALFKKCPYSAAQPGKIKVKFHLASLLINAVVFWYFGCCRITLVDWPSRNFHAPFWEVLAAANGIVFIWNCAILLQFAPQWIQRWAAFVGKNTLGIVIFHFLMIKITLIFASATDAIQWEDVTSVVPPTEMGNRYWLPITVFSLVGSLVFWQIFKSVPILRVCVGQQKECSQKIYCAISEKKACKKLATITEKWNCKYQSQLRRLVKHRVVAVSLFSLLVIVLSGIVLYVQSGVDSPIRFIQLLADGDYVTWTEGRYEDDWVMPQSELECRVSLRDTLVIEGYYPGAITGTQHITVMVNGKTADSITLQDNNFMLSVIFAESGSYLVQIECDFVYPSSNGDSRELAFVATSLAQE